MFCPQGSPKVFQNPYKSLWNAGVRLGGTLGSPKVPPQGKVLRKVPPRFPQGSPRKVPLSPISQLFKSPQKWCCPGNVEYHRFPCSKSRFVSQWPENPTICRDIEMAWGLVVCSMTLWQCRALETSLYPIFQNQNFRC